MDLGKGILIIRTSKIFSAALNIIRASLFLDSIPNAPATKQYVELIQCVMDAYLDKDLVHLIPIEKIWYALIFLFYWRQWIICIHCTLFKEILSHGMHTYALN